MEARSSPSPLGTPRASRRLSTIRGAPRKPPRRHPSARKPTWSARSGRPSARTQDSRRRIRDSPSDSSISAAGCVSILAGRGIGPSAVGAYVGADLSGGARGGEAAAATATTRRLPAAGWRRAGTDRQHVSFGDSQVVAMGRLLAEIALLPDAACYRALSPLPLRSQVLTFSYSSPRFLRAPAAPRQARIPPDAACYRALSPLPSPSQVFDFLLLFPLRKLSRKSPILRRSVFGAYTIPRDSASNCRFSSWFRLVRVRERSSEADLLFREQALRPMCMTGKAFTGSVGAIAIMERLRVSAREKRLSLRSCPLRRLPGKRRFSVPSRPETAAQDPPTSRRTRRARFL
jgi:hypothetical protein